MTLEYSIFVPNDFHVRVFIDTKYLHSIVVALFGGISKRFQFYT